MGGGAPGGGSGHPPDLYFEGGHVINKQVLKDNHGGLANQGFGPGIYSKSGVGSRHSQDSARRCSGAVPGATTTL